MIPPRQRDIAASARQRLLNRARERHEDFQFLLYRYATERFLYRLSQTPYQKRFLLKGAALFALWADTPYRATRDLDFLDFGNESLDELKRIFMEICAEPVAEDGLRFLSESVTTEGIREEGIYGGIRVKFIAMLDSARIPLQADIGYGDAVTPSPLIVDYPVLLDFPPPRLSVYPMETMVSEKLQIMIALGRLNSRLKDFYDLWKLSQEHAFDGDLLSRAIRATLDRRRTPPPIGTPSALTDSFASDEMKRSQWMGFLTKNHLKERTRFSLLEIIQNLRSFLLPPLDSLASDRSFDFNWLPGGPWISDGDPSERDDLRE